MDYQGLFFPPFGSVVKVFRKEWFHVTGDYVGALSVLILYICQISFLLVPLGLLPVGNGILLFKEQFIFFSMLTSYFKVPINSNLIKQIIGLPVSSYLLSSLHLTFV